MLEANSSSGSRFWREYSKLLRSLDRLNGRPGIVGVNIGANRDSEDRLFDYYAGVRIFDLANQFAPREVASWVPPPPAKLIDPRPNVALAAKSADLFVTRDGLIYVSDWNAGLNVLEYRG